MEIIEENQENPAPIESAIEEHKALEPALPSDEEIQQMIDTYLQQITLYT